MFGSQQDGDFGRYYVVWQFQFNDRPLGKDSEVTLEMARKRRWKDKEKLKELFI